MEYNISLLIGYLIGSVPFGFILLKKTHGLDITETGTGNVGAMNSYEITNSRLLGLLVLILDASKGVLSVYIPVLLFPADFTMSALALLGAVFSHCYNPWLKFKGGRGLATAAGGALLMLPIMLLSWLILWAIVYFMRRDIHVGNIMASVLSLLLFINISPIAYRYTYPEANSASELVIFMPALMLLILVRHVDPLRELLKNSSFLNRKRK